ncbi:neutral zinc metallopeptidase [Solirubrobacter sp. CPCC 204708]|uniref:Neutral zinc metallopeptidase n=1 Tax=Solirubrobacter deserti TaxID=2282478 RepID=A0ABT4RCH5_9ACTN|nr:neutral zinc metallopeptidase [Solirubrobacter deserti]MBE2315603.1 neutral zinc metallopeptidase [Solirubrobacter deserti]MDA0136242.1 neutral zinc metallopeptidase [Solirubrobacter deserti]
MRRLVMLLALTLCLGGCGSEDTGNLRDRVDELEQRARAKADELRSRFEQILDEIERAIPEARETSPDVRRGEEDVEAFLTTIVQNIHAYWQQTLRENGLPEPRVFYVWVPPGRVAQSACGPAGDDAAFYCSGDDTIYVSQAFAGALWNGVLRGLPGDGRAAGDFGVAYVVAHEYGHNLQHEFGVFDQFRGPTVRPLELQADCFAGTWGNSVYRQGLLEPGDIEEAIGTALAVGDFDTNNQQHHGTPDERRAAWLRGFESGRPSDCTLGT